MILALDVGNSNIVIGCIDNNGRILDISRIRTESGATWGECAIKLKDILSLMNLDNAEFDGGIISSVVPPVTDAYYTAIKKIIGKEPVVVTNKIKGKLKITVDEPETVAGDLLTGGIAALECYGAPCIVIDMGTATTVTVIDKDGAFSGGAIIPGVGISLKALTSGASLLPEISLSAPEKAIATNTVDCMRSGIVLGTASMLDGIIDRFVKEIGYDCKVVATGGLAPSIIKYCNNDIICDENLLLKGLFYIYKNNK